MLIWECEQRSETFSLQSNSSTDKREECLGDGRSPEGWYTLRKHFGTGYAEQIPIHWCPFLLNQIPMQRWYSSVGEWLFILHQGHIVLQYTLDILDFRLQKTHRFCNENTADHKQQNSRFNTGWQDATKNTALIKSSSSSSAAVSRVTLTSHFG